VANEVKLKIRISDDGALELVGKRARKASKDVDALGNSTDRLSSSKNKYNKLEKGTAGLTSNTTKGFAKQAQMIGGGLVPAYATLAANVFAITAAFGVLQRSAAITQLEEGLIFTGRAAGANLPLLVEGLKEITGAAVSTADAMRAVAVGTSAGFSQSQIEGLAQVAKGASLALGRDMSDALDRLTRGAAKLEPEILDELGIMVRLDDATERYAASVNKTANELSQFERRMAFTNAIIDDGQKKFAALSAVVDPNPYDKLAASFDNLSKTVLGGLNTAFGPIIGFIADNLGVLVGLLGVFATGVIKQAIPALTSGGEAAAEFSKELADSAKNQIAQIKSFKGAPKVFASLQTSIAKGTATEEDMTKATKSLTRSINLHTAQMPEFIKKHGEGSKAVADKKAKLQGAEDALKSITTAQQLETQATIQATKADALNAAATGNLRTAITLTKQALMQEWAATMANAASKGLLSGALTVLSGAFKTAAFSAKVFGLALLNMIPVIGQIIMVGSIALSFLKDFFVKPPTALEEALEKNKEQFDEFPEIITQMNQALAASSTHAEEFMAALKPTSGMLQQVTDMAQRLITVQEQENIERNVQARMRLIDANTRLTEANRRVAESSAQLDNATDISNLTKGIEESDNFLVKFVKGIGNAITLSSNLDLANTEIVLSSQAAANAIEEQTAAQQAANEAQAALENIDPLKTLRGMQEVLTRGISTLQISKIGFAENAEAVALADQKIDGMNKILQDLTAGILDPRGALEALQGLNNAQQAIVGSAEAATETVAEFTELFATRGRIVGTFEQDLRLLDTALKNMAPAAAFPTIMEEYSEVFKKYGVETRYQLEQMFNQVKKINDKLRERGVEQEKEKRVGEELLATGNRVLAAEQSVLTAKNNIKAQEDALKAAKMLNLDLLSFEIALEKAKTAELKEQLKLRSEEAAMRGRTGGEVMGAGAGFEMIATNLDPNAGMTEGITAANAASQATLENLKKLGPEGEAYAAVIGGALNIAESWTNSLDIIADKGATSAEKLQAGFQAAGATINALGQMQQANAKAAVAGIDKEIEAEKRRDGKSRDSMAKIAQLEAKKDQIKRKAFEQDKKMKMAEVVMATASAIMNSLKMGLPWGAVFGSMAAAMGAAQLAVIAGTTYQGGGSTGTEKPSAVSLGQRQTSVDVARSQTVAGELAYFRGQGGMGAGAETFKPSFMGGRYRATGGETVGYTVGEQGPELFIPDRPGTIVPADDTANMMSGATNVNFSINAVDAQGVEEVLMSQRGNIIGMIRDAANSYGEPFLEVVNTNTYNKSRSGAYRR